LTVKVPDDLDRELERAAGERGASKSVLVRLAIRELLDRNAEAGQGSFLDAASDLAGVTEAPADLSSNSRHLDEYGR
jgi:predicted transcriptional regulator